MKDHKITVHSETRGNKLPHIDCVIIGVNVSKTIQRCLESVKASRYPEKLLHISFVDGGSTDNSAAIANQVAGVNVIELGDRHPTPGRGRNSGWRIGNSPYVQFLDGDTIVNEDWLITAVHSFSDEIGAVFGKRSELHPDKTVYNWIADLEWNPRPGLVDSFGGDVMVRRSVLEQTNGYDELLVGGEDPELSRRICENGWQILHLDKYMTGHDLAMTRPRQYMKRAFRSGYGFAAVTRMHKDSGNSFWFRELMRIVIRGGGCLSGLLGAMLFLGLYAAAPSTHAYLGCSAALTSISLILLFFPRLFRVSYFAGDKNLSTEDARVYSVHCSLVVLPQFLGIVRYHLGALFRLPLQNSVLSA